MKKIAARLFILFALSGVYVYAFPRGPGVYTLDVPPSDGSGGLGSCPPSCQVTYPSNCALQSATCDCNCACEVITICPN